MNHRHAWALLAILLVGLWGVGLYVHQAPGLTQGGRARAWFAITLFGLVLTASGLMVIRTYDHSYEDAQGSWQDELRRVERARESVDQRVKVLEQDQREHTVRWQEVQQTLEHAREEVETLTRESAQERARADRIAGELEQVRRTQGQQEPALKGLQEDAKRSAAERAAAAAEAERLRGEIARWQSQAGQRAPLEAQVKELTQERSAAAQEAQALKLHASQLEQKMKEQAASFDQDKKLFAKTLEDADQKVKQLESQAADRGQLAKSAAAAHQRIGELEKALAAAKALPPPAAPAPAPASVVSPPPSPVKERPVDEAVQAASPPARPAAPAAAEIQKAAVEPLKEPPKPEPVIAKEAVPPPAASVKPVPASVAMAKPVLPAAPTGGVGEADVLVVDGSGAMLNQYRNELYKMGFSVHVARTGQDGIRKLGLTSYACLLVNIDLTDMTWQEFLEKVRKANGAIGERVLCCVVPGGKGDQGALTQSGLKWFAMPLDAPQFQGLVKQATGRA